MDQPAVGGDAFHDDEVRAGPVRNALPASDGQQDVVQKAAGRLARAGAGALDEHRRRIVAGGDQDGVVRPLQGIERAVGTDFLQAHGRVPFGIDGGDITQFQALCGGRGIAVGDVGRDGLERDLRLLQRNARLAAEDQDLPKDILAAEVDVRVRLGPSGG